MELENFNNDVCELKTRILAVLMRLFLSVTDHLLEVAVEVNFSQELEESWDQLARSLLLSVKTLVSPSKQNEDITG